MKGNTMSEYERPAVPYVQPDASGLTDGTTVPSVPTVKVKSADTESGFIIINAADLTADHELHVDLVAAPAGKKKA